MKIACCQVYQVLYTYHVVYKMERIGKYNLHLVSVLVCRCWKNSPGINFSVPTALKISPCLNFSLLRFLKIPPDINFTVPRVIKNPTGIKSSLKTAFPRRMNHNCIEHQSLPSCQIATSNDTQQHAVHSGPKVRTNLQSYITKKFLNFYIKKQRFFFALTRRQTKWRV